MPLQTTQRQPWIVSGLGQLSREDLPLSASLGDFSHDVEIA